MNCTHTVFLLTPVLFTTSFHITAEKNIRIFLCGQRFSRFFLSCIFTDTFDSVRFTSFHYPGQCVLIVPVLSSPIREARNFFDLQLHCPHD